MAFDTLPATNLDKPEHDIPAASDLVFAQDLPAGAPRIDSHLRQLLYMVPIDLAEINKNARSRSMGDKTLLDRLDMRFLVLAAMERILDSMGLGEGERDQDLTAYLESLVLEQAPDVFEDDANAVAIAVIDCLRNTDGRKFHFPYWDGKGQKSSEFHLVVVAEDSEGKPRLKLTAEAIGLLTQSLSESSMDQQEITELLLKKAISKGRFDRAENSANMARKIAIRFQEEILELLERAKRRIGSISWTRDVQPRTDLALEHISETILRERLILDQIGRMRADVGSDDKVVIHLDRLEAIIQNCIERHNRLQTIVRNAAATWRELQILAFRPRTSMRLPDLDADVLPNLLHLPVRGAIDAADAIVSGILPPFAHKLFDIHHVIAIGSEPPPARRAEAEIEEGPEEAIEALPRRFPEGMRQEAIDWILERIATNDTMSTLINVAQAEGQSADFQEMLFYVLEQAIHPGEIAGMPDLVDILDNARFDAGFVAGDDVRYGAATDNPVYKELIP